MTVLAAVLAAGSGSRFAGGTHKLLAAFRGRRVVDWVVEQAVDAGLDETAVIVGAIEVPDLDRFGVTVVPNPEWAGGIATSLRAAVRHAAARGHDTVVVGLADQPLVPASAWAAVAAAPPQPPVAVATFDGRRAPPVRLPREVWDLLPERGDAGARVLIGQRRELVREVPCPGEAFDIDTVEDLDRWS